MKFLLILQGAGEARLRRDEFEEVAHDAGELVGGALLADPQLAIQLPGRLPGRLPGKPPGRLPDCEPSQIDGYYVIDVDTRDRAIELARLLPDTQATGRSVEIRALMQTTATDL